MEGMPNDVVELIIAVDLNPSDPEEPINVNSVDVRDKGEGGDECPMCKKILAAISKIDPEMASAVEGVSVDEAVSALEKMASGAPEEAQEEADMFDKAMSRHRPERRPGGRPGGFGGPMGKPFGKKRDEEEDY